MTERNEMPTPVPMWLKEKVSQEWFRINMSMPYSTEFTPGYAGYTIAHLLWERGEREPVDPDVEIAQQMVADWRSGTLTSELVLLAIKRGRELAEAKP